MTVPSRVRRISAALFTALYALLAVVEPTPVFFCAAWASRPVAPCGPCERPEGDEAVKVAAFASCRRPIAALAPLRPDMALLRRHLAGATRSSPLDTRRAPLGLDFPLRC